MALFPFFANFDRFGIEETTWVTPFFQHSHGLTGWSTNLHPIAYFGRATQTGSVVDWAFVVAMGLLGVYWLAGLVDARTPLLVADAQGMQQLRDEGGHVAVVVDDHDAQIVEAIGVHAVRKSGRDE